MSIQELDDELEDNEDTEDEDGEGAAKEAEKLAQDTERKQDRAAIARMQKTIDELNQKVKSGTEKEKKQALSHSEEALHSLLQLGYKPNQLEAIVGYMEGVKKDLTAEFERKTSEKEQTRNLEKLNEDCSKTATRVIKDLIKGSALAGNSHQERALLGQVWDMLANDDQFSSARKAYQSGIEPDAKDFEKAARLVLQTYPKEFGFMEKRESSGNQIDNKNSRPQPHPAVNKKGDVDLSKLSDFERETYEMTLNKTKSPKIALLALNTIGKARR